MAMREGERGLVLSVDAAILCELRPNKNKKMSNKFKAHNVGLIGPTFLSNT
jgi:hypothetical protein